MQNEIGRTGGTVMNAGCIRLLVVLIVVACGVPNQSGAKEEVTPKIGDLAKGKVLFVKYCAGCHGPQGKGDGYKLLGPDPANLTALSTNKKTDADLFATIHEGKPNMPSWKGRFSERDIRNVLAYIRTLSK
jgi:mono/diheme cytochrome c family protein